MNAPGEYQVTVCRDGDELDISSWTVCGTGTLSVSKKTSENKEKPTVTYLRTEDATPTISGSVGGTVVKADEDFKVSIAGTSQSFTKTQITFDNTALTWSVNITTPLTLGSYNVIATRGTETDSSNPDLDIVCDAPKSVINGECISLEPTVDKVDGQNVVTDGIANTVSTNKIRPVIIGTLGNIPLKESGDKFSATLTHAITGVISSSKYSVVISGTTWTLTAIADLPVGAYDITATRVYNGTAHFDPTANEMEIIDSIPICDNGVDKLIASMDFDKEKAAQTPKSYFMGNCSNTKGTDLPDSPSETCKANPLAEKCIESLLIDEPTPIEDEALKSSNLVYCEDGGVKSNKPIEQATIKRAVIMNATTEDGNVNLTAQPTKVIYGVLMPTANGEMDVSGAKWLTINRVEGAALKNVTLDNVYIDTVNADFTKGGTAFMPVTGGKTLPKTLKEDGKETYAVISSGVITAGMSAGNPVRGSMTTGIFDQTINHADTVQTKGRRSRGKLENAIIENVTSTTVNGVTVIETGDIRSGTLTTGSVIDKTTGNSTGVAVLASTFGTVLNATLTGISVSNTNHCFSSGTVGTKGQLNWKEVVK